MIGAKEHTSEVYVDLLMNDRSPHEAHAKKPMLASKAEGGTWGFREVRPGAKRL